MRQVVNEEKRQGDQKDLDYTVSGYFIINFRDFLEISKL